MDVTVCVIQYYTDQWCGPEAANFVGNNFFVDDGLKSVKNTEQATTLIQRTKDLCARGGLRLHKFISNWKEVIAAIPQKDRASTLKNLDLHNDRLPTERALGVYWCVESDTFQLRITLHDTPLTRRGILSTISSIYDPLGFVAPVLLMGKQLLQELCRDKSKRFHRKYSCYVSAMTVITRETATENAR